jgi:hypothetical protein
VLRPSKKRCGQAKSAAAMQRVFRAFWLGDWRSARQKICREMQRSDDFKKEALLRPEINLLGSVRS